MALKIAVIGAGSKGFTQKLVSDVLSYPKMRKDLTFSFMDVNESRLKYLLKWADTLKQENSKELGSVNFEITTDQRKAITDAKYVISTFMVGGWEAYQVDVETPYKYGVSQCVGDSLGPGGVFRFLRNVPVYKEIVKNMREVGYQADQKKRAMPLHLNYTNPMAMNTWFCNSLWDDCTVGLCHGVQGTSNMIRGYVGASPDEFSYMCAGINHMAWFIDLRYKDNTDPNSKWVDAYPIIWDHYKEEPQIMGSENLRWDMFKATGFFMTESSGHLSEYLPYYRKRKDLLEKYAGSKEGFDSLRQAVDMENFKRDSIKANKRAEDMDEFTHLKLQSAPSVEYASGIINGIQNNQPFVFNGNMINKKGGLITNLLANSCVEVPVTADNYGLHPQGGIELPSICAGLCSTNINVQKCAVEGALTMDKEKIYHAILLDPNTASVCSCEEIRSMVDEMFKAESKWLSWWKN